MDNHETEIETTTETPQPPAATGALEAPEPSVSEPSGSTFEYQGIGVKLKSPEELIEYTKNLEKKLVEGTVGNAVRQDLSTPSPVTAPTHQTERTYVDEAEEVLFTDPQKALNILRQGVKKEISDQLSHKDREKKFWDEFYEENPDLKAMDRTVKLVMNEKLEQVKPLPVSSAKKFLAEETRKFVAQVRSAAGAKKEELPEGGAVVVGAGNRHSPVGGKSTPAPKNFVEQMKAFQRKGQR